MNPDDFFPANANLSKYNFVYNTLNSSYLNTGWVWNSDIIYDQSYQDAKNNFILLNVNYIGVKTIYIERPNCEDLINIKELNPTVIVGNDLKTLAKYADSFDDIEGKKGEEITINNIEEIEVSTGMFNSGNFQKEISEEEFNSITTNEKFRSEIVESAITSISSSFLDNFERQAECLKLNPNIYHEKFVEVINNLRDYLEITITDSNGGKLAVINPKTYEITNLKSYKADGERFIEDLLFLVADEFNSLINKNGNPAESFEIILNFLRKSSHKEFAKKIDNYLSV